MRRSIVDGSKDLGNNSFFVISSPLPGLFKSAPIPLYLVYGLYYPPVLIFDFGGVFLWIWRMLIGF